jgi:hypothetical protein
MKFLSFFNNMMKGRDQWLNKNRFPPIHLALR